ncbi:MAG: Zeta toxin family protein [Oceanobacter sp.]|nr:MAG: Zeta toxin family protein [Oceanospirillales bacterium]PHS00284.1 MAG: Zeta toxin family protein [Oceanobacter sp.]
MSRPQFWLVAGPNGAGKSTMSMTIKERFPSVQVIDPDYIAKDMTGSFSSVDQEQFAAGKQALSMVKRYIEEGRSFVAESTISGSTYLKYTKQARECGFRTTFIYVGLSSAQLSGERVSKRVGLGGHAIPIADIVRRYPRSLANLQAHIKAFESAHIYDNSQRYQWIADYRNGMIHKTSQAIPKWIEHYLP